MEEIIFASGSVPVAVAARVYGKDASWIRAGIGYGSINHPVDRDPVCGYNGIINDTCPCCGRSEADGVPFERIRRITGYLVGTLDKWNDAKRAEERDRVKHEVDSNFGD